MAIDASPVDPWLEQELARARVLLERGEAASCLRVLREADRVAVAQGYPQVRPLIAALSREASRAPGKAPRSEPAAARKVARVVSTEPVEARPEPAAAPSPRHPNMRTLGFIWAGVFAAGFVLAAVATAVANDPQTDEAAGAGALAGVVGFGLTLVYLAVSLLLHPRRRHPSWWVIGALFLGGIIAQMAAAALGAPDSPAGLAVWVLIGVYVVGSLALRRD